MIVYLNGELVPAERAAVSPFDHGVTVGDGVFETLRVYRGTPFAVRRHLDRLRVSARGLGMPPLPAEQELRAALTAVVDANSLTEGRLRITVTGGPSPLGSTRGDGDLTVVVAAGPLEPWPEATEVITVPWPRNERGALAGLKTTSYGENVVALARAREAGAGEAIFGNLAGNLCEGTGTNVFVARAGRLVTPPLSSGCLPGITRALLLELPELDVVEQDVPLAALAEADEAFLTSSTREVQAIAAVDGRRLPAAPGPLTRQARDAFTALVARDLDP